MKRHRQQPDVVSQEISFFVSNAQPASQLQAADLFAAIRQHWCLEPGRRAVIHYQRDVTLAKDNLRTVISAVSRLIGSLRTLGITC